MLEDDDYVYFFLREQAAEYINCGKVNNFFLEIEKFKMQNFMDNHYILF